MQYSTQLLRRFRRMIGQNIRQERTRQRMPLSKLARLSGVPERMLDLYELGKCEIRLDELLRIACSLKKAPESFLLALPHA